MLSCLYASTYFSPFVPQLCGKEFNRMHNLMGHMHLHSDSKPFKCLYCPSKFTLKGNLTRHMKVKHGVMDRGLDERCKNTNTVFLFLFFCCKTCSMQLKMSLTSVFRRRGRFCMSTPMSLLARLRPEEPFDLSHKPPGLHGLRISQSDGESVPGSSYQEEDEESLYRRSQYSPEVDQHEPAGEDQYTAEQEERGQGSPAEQRPEEKQKESLDEQREPAAVGHSVDPRGDQANLSQSEETCELADHQEQDESEQSKRQIDVCDVAVGAAGTNRRRSETGGTARRSHACELAGRTGPRDEEE